MTELLKTANNGQWSLVKGQDEKGRCTSCGDKTCLGDCKTADADAVKANDQKNKEFKNKIRIANNGQWKLGPSGNR